MELDKLRQDIVFTETLRGHCLTFHSTWGLFNPKGVDAGSRLLLEHIEVSEDATCLVTPGITTGCISCLDDGDCAVGQTCEDGACVGEPCDPADVCDPPGGPKRYCGSDGCGGYCAASDFSCNGTGICDEDG